MMNIARDLVVVSSSRRIRLTRFEIHFLAKDKDVT